MLRSLPLLLATATLATSASLAQVQVDEFLLGYYFPDELVHLRADGTVVRETASGPYEEFVGAGILPDGRWVTARHQPSRGVNIYDPTTGELLSTFPTDPAGLAGDLGVFPDGTIVVVEPWLDQLHYFQDDGTLLQTVQMPPGCDPWNLHIDVHEEVWITDNYGQRVYHFDRGGTLLGSFPVAGRPGGIVRADDGTLWTTNRTTREVLHYQADGTFLGSFGTGILNNELTTIGLASDGTIWTTTDLHSFLFHFDVQGNSLGYIQIPSGGAYFMTVGRKSDIGTSYCGPGVPNSSGQPGEIRAYGSQDVSDNILFLTATQLPVKQFGYFLASQTQGFVPMPGGSEGNLCLGGKIGRFAQQSAKTGLAGTLSLSIDLTQIPTAPPSAVQPGETWNFQAWHREVQPGATSNFTDGVSVTF